MNHLATFVITLSQLYGVSCWGYALHESGRQHRLGLALGTKSHRAEPLTADIFSDKLKQFTPQFTLFTQLCSWRFEDNQAILCTSKNDREIVRQTLDEVVGQTIHHVRLAKPGLDLIMQFENDMILRLFCDAAIATGPQSVNYQLYTTHECFDVAVGMVLKRMPRPL